MRFKLSNTAIFSFVLSIMCMFASFTVDAQETHLRMKTKVIYKDMNKGKIKLDVWLEDSLSYPIDIYMTVIDEVVQTWAVKDTLNNHLQDDFEDLYMMIKYAFVVRKLEVPDRIRIKSIL